MKTEDMEPDVGIDAGADVEIDVEGWSCRPTCLQ